MSDIYGAKGRIFVKSSDDMKELSAKISKGLILHDFIVEHSQDPPYELTGSCEALGFQIWLNKSDIVNGYNYIFEMESSLSDDELSSGQMYDLSLWLGRFVSIICDLDTCVVNENNNLTVFRSR